MDEGGYLLKGEGGGGIYRVMRDCPTSQDVSPDSPKSGKLRKKDEIVIIEWRLLASPPVMRVRCAEGWTSSAPQQLSSNTLRAAWRRTSATRRTSRSSA